MKKFRLFMAALLSAGVMASGAALTACNGDGEGGANTKPIDEQTWQAAFDELDYTNVSFRPNVSDADSIVMLSENAAYYKFQRGDEYLDEIYSVKNDDGTYTNYSKHFNGSPNGYETIENTTFSCSIDSYGLAFNYGKEAITVKISYKDDYNEFNFDKDLQAFVYNDVIEVEHIFYEELSDGSLHYDISTFNCVDNVVKISNDKIISCSFRGISYSCVCHCTYEDHNTSNIEVNTTCEYYDIGTTVVEIPEELLAMRPWNLPDVD
ncbi:MAG: hypothetical protein K2K04_05825 [Clostridia bacterium]|nr:hypothetical protein [Clostridia bacterium]